MTSVPGVEAPQEQRHWTDRVSESVGVSQDLGWPYWLLIIRQVIVFGLGVAIIIRSVWVESKNIAYLVMGLILIGIVPIEDTINRLIHRQEKKDARQSPTSSPSSLASPESSLP